MVMTISYARDGKTTVSNQAQPAAATSGGTPYSLTAVNNSAQPWVIYVYQKMPNQSNDLFSLAWFASPYQIRVGDQIRFQWEVDYNFVWSDTGTLIPGVNFFASGSKDASPDGANSTNFSTDPGPGLSDPVQASPKGSLIINDASDVPNNRYSVGIGMSGAGTYVVQAGTNLKHQFTPTPSYWIAAGIDQKVGTVLDIQTITQTSEVKYDPNVYDKTATLGSDNNWTIS
ncbi:hypothetical protein [Microbulbifer halophilus]|nr:hypothetical protein [Microbulbifer halophilus]MCW8127570.1 hypothetical protein [Microbulbifer halophilus]